MEELTLAIVGIDYPNDDKAKSNRRMELLLTPPGEEVELRFEPKNSYDENAIAVFSARGIQVGHLSAERAPWIGKRMQVEEHLAVFQALHGNTAYLRIRFGGGTPTLPPPVAAPPIPARPQPLRAKRTTLDPDAFYPDPEGPDWGA